MRRLFALGLTICVAGTASAQTEVIIRRQGQKDQVIRLDSTRSREALRRVEEEVERTQSVLRQKFDGMRENLGTARIKELRELTAAPARERTLAFKNRELAAETMLAPMMKQFAMRQPHLGVVVATTPRETDRYGAYIQAVTPGSPADKAGIISGDVITRLAGKSLTDKDDKDDSGPGVRLISIIGTLTVGKSVEVDLRRGTQNKSVKVTPDEDEGGMIARMAPSIARLSRTPGEPVTGSFSFNGDLPPRAFTSQGMNLFGGPNGTFGYSFGGNGLFASYELAPLNDKLGAYFGTSEGVLVVNTRQVSFYEAAPSAGMSRDVTRKIQGNDTTYVVPGSPRARMIELDSVRARAGVAAGRGGRIDRGSVYVEGVPSNGMIARRSVDIGLEPGDVIVSVDGRKVSSPSQLMKIVGTYERNDEFKLQIMRQKRAETLTVKLP